MSDPNAKPGAPADGAAKKEVLPASTVQGALQPTTAIERIITTPDRVLLRLNKLISAPGGLSSFLSTFNYTLYLLAYLDSKSHPLRDRINTILGKAVIHSGPAAAAPHPLAILGSAISSARTTFRLVGLIPIYAWMRRLLQGPAKGQDQVLWATAFAQCSLYGAFQLLENIAVLIDLGVLPKSTIARWHPSGDTARLKLWCYRAWFGGVLCDFVRLAREAQVERVRRAVRPHADAIAPATIKADEQADLKWWLELIVPIGWFPMALHCSLEKGLPNFGLGTMGMSGFTAGLPKTAALWAMTAEG